MCLATHGASRAKISQGTAVYRDGGDLSTLHPEDLERVCRWVEDRFINAVTPLAIRMQIEFPDGPCADRTLQAAQWAVKGVLEAVEELRTMIGETTVGSAVNASPPSHILLR
jgi:acetoin utilization deacetylase AcuC-like enzyme